MAKQNKPAIRFKGFTDAWEQRKLGALCVEFKSGDFISASDIAENEAYPVYGGNGLRGFTNHYNHDGEYALIGRQGALCGNVNYAVGKSYFTEHAVAVRANKTNHTRFLYYLFSTMNLGQYSGQSAQPGLAVGNLIELENVVPSKPEQEKIAGFLSSLDNLITLHQRKYDKLQVLKKAMLEKMFPKNGSSVPEIRFKGFTDAWEQRKAKELCNIGTGKSNTQDQVEDGIYPFYIRSDIPVKSNKYLYDCEAVITIGDGNIGRVFHYVNGKFDLHQRCYKMTDFQDIWGKYFYYFFSTRFYDRAMKMTAKATVDSVRLEMISEMDIWKPTAIDEQKKIAEFFANLDHLITLHQRKSYIYGMSNFI